MTVHHPEAAPARRLRTGADPTAGEPTCRLHEEDIELVAQAVVRVLRRERLVDDLARSLRARLAELRE